MRTVDARRFAETAPVDAPPYAPDLGRLLSLTPDALGQHDIAAVNLACAVGLPGAEELNVGRCLDTLAHWIECVRLFTRDNLSDYQRNPDEYHRHKGFFRFLCMVTVLKKGLGVGYQPTAVGNFDYFDSRDDLLHGLLTRRLGTCASLPVLFVAIGRRLGYPMHLAVASRHVLCQWVNPDGSRLNLEGSCPGGGETFPDGHYHAWPHPLTPKTLATGKYLRPLTRAEEFSLFLRAPAGTASRPTDGSPRRDKPTRTPASGRRSSLTTTTTCTTW